MSTERTRAETSSAIIDAVIARQADAVFPDRNGIDRRIGDWTVDDLRYWGDVAAAELERERRVLRWMRAVGAAHERTGSRPDAFVDELPTGELAVLRRMVAEIVADLHQNGPISGVRLTPDGLDLEFEVPR